MDYGNLLLLTLNQVWHTFLGNWPYLLASVVIATLLKLYLNADKVSSFLLRHRRAGVVLATGAAVGTPLCSCGTTAVILGMMANLMPWAPVVAFMVASPLTSPQELIYSAGLFGWPFALTFFAASVVLGLVGGWAAGWLESRGWLKNQARFLARTSTPALAKAHRVRFTGSTAMTAFPACGCSEHALAPVPVEASGAYANIAEPSCRCTLDIPVTKPFCGCGTPHPGIAQACGCRESNAEAVNGNLTGTVSNGWKRIAQETTRTGFQLLLFFLGFAFIGYFLNNLIPPSWIPALFGSGRAYSVPLAATLGLPFYLNTEASLPLVRSLIDGGMSQGASLAFLITGAGTSVGAIAGALTIARWRVIALVMATLWLGAIVFGLGYDVLLSL
ncbi:MAG: permease [bacterium]